MCGAHILSSYGRYLGHFWWTCLGKWTVCFHLNLFPCWRVPPVSLLPPPQGRGLTRLLVPLSPVLGLPQRLPHGLCQGLCEPWGRRGRRGRRRKIMGIKGDPLISPSRDRYLLRKLGSLAGSSVFPFETSVFVPLAGSLLSWCPVMPASSAGLWAPGRQSQLLIHLYIPGAPGLGGRWSSGLRSSAWL